MDKTKITSFTDLHVWQEGHKLVLTIYEITLNFPQTEIYGLTNQMRSRTNSYRTQTLKRAYKKHQKSLKSLTTYYQLHSTNSISAKLPHNHRFAVS